tara:strand:+ start:66 stop:824 length:759 start_codon:yes stop_codon:yes gene_type:complete
MSKNIELDKFYTPKETAKKCIDIFWNTFFDVTEIIEPSAGSGSFSLQIPNCIAYDLEPEHESIIKQDFLKLDLPYKQGRAFIGNPPFGYTNNLSRSFYKHACKMADMIAFILPIGLLNNTDSLYEFDLVKSFDLGIIEYSGYKVHCCFNLYHRPKNGKLNKKPNYKLNWIDISRDDEKRYKNFDYDFAICRRGNIGKLRTKNLQSSTHKIKVLDRTKIDFVKNTILNFDWLNNKPFCSTPYITKNDIWKLFN